MSVEAMSWALRVPIGGNPKVLLLGIANHAHPDGTEAYPTLDTLAMYACCDRSTARRNVRRLIALGYVLEDGLGSKGQAKYRLPLGLQFATHGNLPGGTSARGGVANGGEGGGIAVPPEPSLEPSLEPSNGSEIAPSEQSPRHVADCPEAGYISHRLADLILARDPKAKVAPDSKPWLDAARLLLTADKREFVQVEEVLDWLPTDEFWPTVIFSMPKFRAKFARLVATKERPRRRHRESAGDLLDAMDEAAKQRHAADERQNANQQLGGLTA